MRHFKYILLHGILIFVLIACVSCSNISPQMPEGKTIKIENPAPNSGKPAFTLGPEDQISVRVWRNSDLDRTFTIGPSGIINFPLAGEIDASGKTTAQLNKEITARLSKYITQPYVDVNINTVASRKIHVLGQVKSPGTFNYTDRIAVWEAISKAGGFTENANKLKYLLVRIKNNDAYISVQSLDFQKIFENGVLQGEYDLKNGDIIYVPEVRIASIERFMQRLNTIITPLYTIQRMITITPNMMNAIHGDTNAVNITP